MVVLLLDGIEAHDGNIVLGPDAVSRVARLGVSRISVLRDRSTVGLVLEGWALDPASAPLAAGLLGVGRGSRALHPSLEIAVSGTAGGEWDDD
jgi:hypothetical protein